MPLRTRGALRLTEAPFESHSRRIIGRKKHEPLETIAQLLAEEQFEPARHAVLAVYLRQSTLLDLQHTRLHHGRGALHTQLESCGVVDFDERQRLTTAIARASR